MTPTPGNGSGNGGNGGDRLPSWFRMSSTYFYDDKIMGVSIQAEAAFVRLVAFASQLASSGEISLSQCQLIMHKLRSYRQVIDELAAANLISLSSCGQLIYIKRWSKWQGRGGGGNTVADVSAGQEPADDPSRARARTRGPAREREDRLEEVGRTASQSDRPTSAAAAPPRADAGAQPQQDQSQVRRGPGRRAFIEGDEDTRSWRDLAPPGESGGVSSVGQQRLAEMREELKRRQQTNPYSRGRPVKMVPDGWRATEPPIRAEVVQPIEADDEYDDPNPPQALGYLMTKMLPPPPDFPEWEAVKE